MVNKTLISRITIVNYLKQVELSKAQRPKYYLWNGVTIKSGSKKLLQKYINKEHKNKIIRNNGNVTPNDLAKPYAIVEYRGAKPYIVLENALYDKEIQFSLTEKQLSKTRKYYLCDISLKDGQVNIERVMSNESKIGEPRMHIIKGQDFYVGLNPFIRNKLVHELKSSYYDKFKTLTKEVEDNFRNRVNNNYPLIIEMEIHDTVKSEFDNTKQGNGRRWDVGNRAEPYMKTFLDFLVNGYKDEEDNVLLEPFIIDDDRLHVSSGNNSYFIPITEEETPKLVFNIYKDNNPKFIEYLRNE